MKHNSSDKKRNPLEWVIIGIISFFIFPFALVYVWVVDFPMFLKMQETHYWMTWKDLKRITGRSTFQVIQFLWGFSQEAHSPLECKLREERDLEKITRLTGHPIPEGDYPQHENEVIFYQFRVKRKGGGKKKKWVHKKIPAFGILSPVSM